jgi:hypothetical protein
MSSSVTLNGSSAVQVQINVTTNANSLVTQWITMRFPGSTPGLIGLSVALCFLQFWSAFHRRLRRGYLVLCVFTILAAVCVVGCGSGGGSISGSSSAVTQSGDYTLTVMGSAGSGATSQTHSVVVTLIVN